MKIYLHIKTMVDWVFALILLTVLSPLFLAVAIAVKTEDGGLVFFSQIRTGQYMRRFRVYKFRTMKRTDVVFDKNCPVIETNNKNLTKVGRFLRKYKIDELPQLINILKGEMCFISPRPLLPAYEKDYADWERIKFLVKPGLTGLGQVNGNGYLDIEDRNYYDALYVMNLSFRQDAGIFFRTIGVILRGESAYIRRVSSVQRDLLKVRIKARYDPVAVQPRAVTGKAD